MNQGWPKSTKDAAEYLGIPKQTFNRRISRAGLLPVKVESQTYCWTEEQIEKIKRQVTTCCMALPVFKNRNLVCSCCEWKWDETYPPENFIENEDE